MNSLKHILKIFILILLCWQGSAEVQGQEIEIRGVVSLSDGSPEIYNILALRADSSIYKGSVCMKDRFSFSVNPRM